MVHRRGRRDVGNKDGQCEALPFSGRSSLARCVGRPSMNRCLRDKTLLLLHDGEGTRAERGHLQECEACAARYRQLELDLGAIGQVLRQEPPLETTNYRFRRLNARWFPAAVAVPLALILVWKGMQIWNPSVQPPLKATNNGETWSILDELPSTPFLVNEALAV